jgi:hypothetical protein
MVAKVKEKPPKVNALAFAEEKRRHEMNYEKELRQNAGT